MVDELKLSAVLGEFARTMVMDSSVQEIIDRLAAWIVQIIPSTRAGITLPANDAAPRYVAGSDSQAIELEQLQSNLVDGPSSVARSSGEAVTVVNVFEDGNLASFATVTACAGLQAMFAFPLRHDCDRLGAMTLYCHSVGALGNQEMIIAQTFADVAASYLAMARARDEARAAADNFKQLSLHDPLTGLPNRQLLEDRIRHAAEHARRSQTAAAVLFADLDQFKSVNDAYGHGVGDELLMALAHRLSALLRSSDTLARASGDEFVFLCEDLTTPEDADLIVARIAEALATPFKVSGLELTVSASVGVAYVGAGERISADLIADADAAMYAAKRARFGLLRHRTGVL